MIYSCSKDINSDFNKTKQKFKYTLMNIEFGVLTEINMKDTFKSKFDLNYKNYKIFGACNPKLAFDNIS